MSDMKDFLATLTPEEQEGIRKYHAYRSERNIAARKARIRRNVESQGFNFTRGDLEGAVEHFYRVEMSEQGRLGGRGKKAHNGDRD